MITEVNTVEEQELRQELTVVQQAALVKISDQTSYDQACDLLQDKIIPFRRRWKEYWESVKKPAYAAYKAIQDKFNEGDEPAERAERAVKAEIRRWDEVKERERQELQAKAQREAEAEAEKQRLEEAMIAEELGSPKAEVEQMLSAPLTAVAAPVERTYDRARGMGSRENWKAKVTDFHALVKAAAKDKSLLPYLMVNQSSLDKRAKADKSTMSIAGVVPYNDTVVTARGR